MPFHPKFMIRRNSQNHVCKVRNVSYMDQNERELSEIEDGSV